MLRKIIGRPKSSNKKRKEQDLALPKSLWGFYFKYALPGVWMPFCMWALFYVVALSNSVLFPYFERWFVQLFETPVPDGMNFVQFALPTILLIVGLNVMISIASILRGMYHARWAPKLRNRVNEVLTDFVHHQSMSFWTGRMAGKVNSEINFISDGFWVVEDLWRVVWLIVSMLISAGLIFTINVYVAIIFACVFVFRVAYSWMLIKPMNKAAKEASGASSSLSGKLVDSISNYSVVKLFAGARHEQQYLEKPRQKHVSARVHSFFVQRLFWGVPAE